MISQHDDDDYGSDDDYDRESECDHNGYEIDILTGRAECDYCQHSWYVSGERINAEIERQANYHEDMERENRRQWWRDLRYAIWHPFQVLKERLLRRRYDDEIPF